MKYTNEIFFLIATIILWGIVAASKPLLNRSKFFQPENYWFFAIVLSASAYSFFASASSVSLVLLTLANTCMVAGSLYMALFCRSLRNPEERAFKLFPLFALLVFAVIFEYLRQGGFFFERVALTISISSICVIWQLTELILLDRVQRKKMWFFMLSSSIAFLFGLARFAVFFVEKPAAGMNIYQEPFLVSVIRWSWFSLTVVSYVALIGYRIDKKSTESAQATNELNTVRLELAEKKLQESQAQLSTSEDRAKLTKIQLDVTQKELIEREQQLRYVLNVTGNGIWDWNIVSGQVEHNSRWMEMLDENPSQQQFSIEDFKNRIHPDDLNAVFERLKLALEGSQPYSLRYRMMRHDGRQIWVEDKGAVVETSADGQPLRMVGAIQDISDEVSAQEKIQELIFFDYLTKLPNRRYIKERIDRVIRESARNQAFSGLMYLDLNDFKLVNDSHGHQVGDAFLQEFGARLQNAVRPTDIVARIGGDEYLILLEHIGLSIEEARKGLQEAVERILKSLIEPFKLGNNISIFARTSIGLVAFGNDVQDFDELLLHSDLAMYAAKEDLNMYYRFYDQKLKDEFDRRSEFLTGLKEASSLNQFYVEYQPILNHRGESVFYEALARWEHSVLGTVMPDDFIPIAEANGQMNEVGHAILKHIFSNHRLWSASEVNQCNLMINISAHQLMNIGFAEEFLSLAAEYLVPLDRILIEVTESVFLSNTETVIGVMTSLRKRSVKFVLDDFGTGYSSLAYLQKLPIEYLKIDKSFIGSMTRNQDDLAIVHNILALGKSLQLQVIAEGVETQEQFDQLLSAGCHFFQGWYFGSPRKNP